jgi:5'-AMP-activated protein kinase, catalytic alpha subunit
MPRNGIPQNEPKKRVGNYLLGNTVGEGTFGKVKIAIHIPTGEKVAVKILEKKRIQDQADVRRVNREIKILKKARHANIIQLYEVLDTPNSIYLMMENADGGEMFDYIVANRHVPERQACKFFHQILNGVEELHRNEITHRDLKPENLLLKNSPEGFLIKIVDFGLSNTHDVSPSHSLLFLFAHHCTPLRVVVCSPQRVALLAMLHQK